MDTLDRLHTQAAAQAIYEAGIDGRAERYVPRPYGIAAALRVLAPGFVRRALGGSGAAVMTTTTVPTSPSAKTAATPRRRRIEAIAANLG